MRTVHVGLRWGGSPVGELVFEVTNEEETTGRIVELRTDRPDLTAELRRRIYANDGSVPVMGGMFEKDLSPFPEGIKGALVGLAEAEPAFDFDRDALPMPTPVPGAVY